MHGKVLVVDDVATNRIILRVKLSTAFYHVLQAENGSEALEVARSEEPDLILLDLAMPGMEGTDVCRKLKADPRTADIPVVIVTAGQSPTARLDALRAGANDFIEKPFDDTILLARLRSLMRARATAAELALRDSTTEALGFAEPGPSAADFAPAGRIAFVATRIDDATRWRQALAQYMPNRIDVLPPVSALRQGKSVDVADVVVIPETMQRPGDGLQLMAELRARPATRHALVMIAVDRDDREQAAMALDLGAADLLTLPFEPEEAALRLKAQLARKAATDRLRDRVHDGLQLAITDPLTGLYNRRYGLGHLERIHARALERGRNYALMMLDLDRFKAVNDTHGHPAGDEVLRATANRLRSALRSVDLVARIGGEEFLVVMPDIGRDGADRAAERLRQTVSDTPIALPSGERVSQTISIGFAMGGADLGQAGTKGNAVIAAADAALLAAKAKGRNRAQFERCDQTAA